MPHRCGIPERDEKVYRRPGPRWVIVLVVMVCTGGESPCQAEIWNPGEIFGSRQAQPAPDQRDSTLTIHGQSPDPWAAPPVNGPLPATAYPPLSGTGEPWDWHVLPEGLVYRSYLGGIRESRLGTTLFHEDEQGWLMEMAIGGRVGLLRYGTSDAFRPEGFEWDMEAAVFPRFELGGGGNLISADFRAGVPLTYSSGAFQWKLAYSHLESHVGDDYLIANPTFVPVDYKWDGIVFGSSVFLNPDLRIYGEVGFGFAPRGDSEPWQFQFGADYSPVQPTGSRGTPFATVNGQLFQENDFGGNLVVQGGWQWKGRTSGRVRRLGLQYFNGRSSQTQFYRTSEQQIGLGAWFDY